MQEDLLLKEQCHEYHSRLFKYSALLGHGLRPETVFLSPLIVSQRKGAERRMVFETLHCIVFPKLGRDYHSYVHMVLDTIPLSLSY